MKWTVLCKFKVENSEGHGKLNFWPTALKFCTSAYFLRLIKWYVYNFFITPLINDLQKSSFSLRSTFWVILGLTIEELILLTKNCIILNKFTELKWWKKFGLVSFFKSQSLASKKVHFRYFTVLSIVMLHLSWTEFCSPVLAALLTLS